jgi:peptidoglycan/LPS O-acetylase OafA/YrhL
MHKGQERVRYLDGLRGLAILLVLAWHYLGPVYAMHLPYGTSYAHLPVVRIGWVGVNLFFLISGYVIFMTLERCHGFVDFMLRRWLRLFPAMLVGSLLIFGAAQAIGPEMPGGEAHMLDLVPGLTLINPIYFTRYFDLPVRSLDGAFWSLYVEAAFYIVIGSLFFLVGWARAVAGLLILWAVLLIAPPIAYKLHLVHWMAPPYRIIKYAGVGYFGWFASGALFQKARATEDRGLFVLAVVIGLAASVTTAIPDLLEKTMRVALALSVLLFAAAEQWRLLQRLLEARWLQFVGFISYPLYLVHSALGVGLIALVASVGHLPGLATALLVTATMILLAWGIAAWAEPAVASLLRPFIKRVRRWLHVPGGPGPAQPIGSAAPAGA